MRSVWLGPRVGVKFLSEFRIRKWTQEEIHESWHADTPEQVIAKVRQGQKMLTNGQPLIEVIKELQVTEAT